MYVCMYVCMHACMHAVVYRLEPFLPGFCAGPGVSEFRVSAHRVPILGSVSRGLGSRV